MGKQLLGQTDQPVEEPPVCGDWDRPTIDLDEFDELLDEAEAEIEGDPQLEP